jgi:hypothetical protein
MILSRSNGGPGMVDRRSRVIGATVLRDFIDGRITNDEFMEKFPRSTDPALNAILEFTWMQFSDLRVHKLAGHDAPTFGRRALLERCCVFLKTELEFEWPLPKHPVAWGLLQIITFGLRFRRFDEEYKSKGEFEVWPFIRRSDYDIAAKIG